MSLTEKEKKEWVVVIIFSILIILFQIFIWHTNRFYLLNP